MTAISTPSSQDLPTSREDRGLLYRIYSTVLYCTNCVERCMDLFCTFQMTLPSYLDDRSVSGGWCESRSAGYGVLCPTIVSKAPGTRDHGATHHGTVQRRLSDLTRVSSPSRLCNMCGIITVQKECPASSRRIRGSCDHATLTHPQGSEGPQPHQCRREPPEREKRKASCPRVHQVSHGFGVRAIRLPGEQ